MITILSRPIGYTLPTTSVQGAVTRDVADVGKVLVTSIAHGLVESQVIYIKSNIEDYNGFYQINYRTVDTFRLYKTPINKIVWVQDAPITFFVTTGQCNWSCVHLPITYKILSNKYPTNYLDPAVTISSYINDSGYVNLTLSAPLAGSVNDLDYIKITGSTSPNIDGVYQIMEANSTSNITISLVYDSYVFGSASVNRWYNNYHIVINVYAGLNSSHFFASKKPYELAGTLRIIPSTDLSLTGASLGDNAAFFSINEILKSYVKTNNNLLLGTLPNNLDAVTEFYIETYESYDVGTGYSFLNFESAHVSDQSNFEGFAVNAKLPFKNIQSGYLSDYLMNNATAKFLTLFAIPVMFAGCADKDDCYFDVSFINPLPYNASTLLYLRQAYYKKGILQSTVDKLISNYDNGVYRAQPDNPSCANDRVDLNIVRSGQTMIAPSSFLDGGVSGSVAFNSKSLFLFVEISPASTTFYSAYTPVSLPTGTVMTLNVTASGVNYVGPLTGLQVFFELRDKTLTVSNSIYTITLLSGSFAGTIVLPASTAPSSYFLVYAFYNGTSIDQISITVSPNTNDTIYAISETKQVTINCDCNNQNIRLMWLNYLGGYDSWLFTTLKDYLIDIPGTTETKQNIFPDWPKSYGANADTIRKQVSRESTNQIAIHSQNVNEDELQAIEYIKTSPLVQIVKSRTDRRTVIVDKNSFKVYTDSDKLHTIDMVLTFTDDIPSQSV